VTTEKVEYQLFWKGPIKWAKRGQTIWRASEEV